MEIAEATGPNPRRGHMPAPEEFDHDGRLAALWDRRNVGNANFEAHGREDLHGLAVIDSRRRRIGRVVGVLWRKSGEPWALVSPRLWFVCRARAVPIRGAHIHDGVIELPRPPRVSRSA